MSDAQPLNPNPYASPQAESFTPNELPHFGLSEPICLEGVKTVEHLLLAEAAVDDKSRWGRHASSIVTILFLSLFPLYVITYSLPGGYLINLAVAFVLVAFYVFAMFAVVPWYKRRQFEKRVGAGQPERYLLAEETFTCAMEHSQVEHRWELFWCYRERNELLILRLQDYDEVFVIPRSFCPSESLWHTVLELVACKMPLWEKGKNPEPLKIEPLIAHAAVIEEQSSTEGIEAAGQYTPAQLRQATRLCQPYWPLRYLYGTLLLGGLGIWAVVQWNSNQSSQSSYWLVIACVVLTIKFVAARWAARTAWLERRGPYEWQNWLITPEQLKINTATTSQTIEWELFKKIFVRRNQVILLLQSRTFFLLPRSFFAGEAEWQRFLELVEEKCEP